ncbi:NUDIX hydrolase [Nonomuraea sp. SYSU D8015]|uniref:NUDIX hydrolase n=1 Tax=Nonomuraea sp. SYSU D8015 TaxID=2593644 RepID=UPI00166101BD|nr:NUDIX hydrolase [Nonomuraea sp. SYSU D8015]
MLDPFEEYNELRRSRPDLFVNPHATVIQDLDPSDREAFGLRYRDPYVILLRDKVRFPDGSEGGYVRIVHAAEGAGAAILPVHEGKVVLVEHFRHATRRSHWKIPRGFCAPNETVADTAARELTKELGCAAKRLCRIGTMHADTGLIAHSTGLFWAEVGPPGRLDTSEGIRQVALCDRAELSAWMSRGDITDSFTLSALSLVQELGLPPYARESLPAGSHAQEGREQFAVSERM